MLHLRGYFMLTTYIYVVMLSFFPPGTSLYTLPNVEANEDHKDLIWGPSSRFHNISSWSSYNVKDPKSNSLVLFTSSDLIKLEVKGSFLCIGKLFLLLVVMIIERSQKSILSD